MRARSAPKESSKSQPTITTSKQPFAVSRLSGRRKFGRNSPWEPAIMTNLRSILCVDDEERDLQLQRATFEAAGYQVRLARDLYQVRQVLEQHPVDAVVL